MIRRAIATLALAAAGCNGAVPAPAPSPMPSRPPEPPIEAIQSHVPLTPEQRETLAVASAFPNGVEVSFDGVQKRKFDEHRLVDTAFDPVLVSAGFMEDGPHAEGGLIAVHYLYDAGDGFSVRPGYPRTFEIGSYGTFGKWSVSDRFADVPVVQAEGGGTFQGFTCTTALLIELRRDGPAEVAAVQLGYDDGGAVEQGAEQITGTIGDIVKGKSFTVRYTGTRSFAERYVRRGGRFVLEGESQLPTC